MAIFTFDVDQQLIKSDDKNVRVLLVGEEKRDPWFRGNDVANLLGYSNESKRAVSMHVSQTPCQHAGKPSDMRKRLGVN